MGSKILKYSAIVSVIAVYLVINGCHAPVQTQTEPDSSKSWLQEFDKQLPMLGHRNWILVVDKAFPKQNSAGIEYINANADLLPVLQQVLSRIHESVAVNPIIYQDKELGYITESQSKGVTQFVKDAKTLFGAQPIKTMLHDSVFKQLDTEAKLFKVLVIKTNETIPYTSVFIRLDCAYWSGDKEKELRLNMNK